MITPIVLLRSTTTASVRRVGPPHTGAFQTLAIELTCRNLEHESFLLVSVGGDLEGLQDEKTSIAACATRLLPSKNG